MLSSRASFAAVVAVAALALVACGGPASRPAAPAPTPAAAAPAPAPTAPAAPPAAEGPRLDTDCYEGCLMSSDDFTSDEADAECTAACTE